MRKIQNKFVDFEIFTIILKHHLEIKSKMSRIQANGQAILKTRLIPSDVLVMECRDARRGLAIPKNVKRKQVRGYRGRHKRLRTKSKLSSQTIESGKGRRINNYGEIEGCRKAEHILIHNNGGYAGKRIHNSFSR